MKVKKVFELGLKMAVVADPRGSKGVAEYLKQTKNDFNALPDKEKPYFEMERLTNPYSDSRIHVDDEKSEVKRVMAGIDIDNGEILLASQLGERGKKIDLVIAHHPVGKGLAALHDVMDMAVESFEKAGVPVHTAEKIMEERIREVGRSVHASNHFRVVNTAELLGVNFINTHTITDNLVAKFLEDYLAKHKPRTVGQIIDLLMQLPEYQIAKRQGSGPVLFAGSPKHRVGKYIVEMTGGTEPSDKIYRELSNFGIGTVIGMHMRDKNRDIALEHHMNVIIAGHIASDSLGMNLFLDELEKQGIEVVPCGGLIRVSRVKKNKK